jgi:CheY-like chemotaxis protein
METADILIVEDDKSLLEVTSDYLTDQGFTVKTCVPPGFRIAESGEITIEAIFTVAVPTPLGEVAVTVKSPGVVPAV